MTEIKNTQILDWATKNGIAKLVLGFSGGNDEGGVDTKEAFNAAGETITLPALDSQASKREVFDGTTKTWRNDGWMVYEWDPKAKAGSGYSHRPATPEEIEVAQLREALERPIDDRWGSFAGEFSVEGTLTWDFANGTCRLEGQESVQHYESFEEDL